MDHTRCQPSNEHNFLEAEKDPAKYSQLKKENLKLMRESISLQDKIEVQGSEINRLISQLQDEGFTELQSQYKLHLELQSKKAQLTSEMEETDKLLATTIQELQVKLNETKKGLHIT